MDHYQKINERTCTDSHHDVHVQGVALLGMLFVLALLINVAIAHVSCGTYGRRIPVISPAAPAKCEATYNNSSEYFAR